MQPENSGLFSKDAAAGAVRTPPPLQSILRLQRTVGNHAAQRILGIGDGRRVAAPAEEHAPRTPPRKSWSFWTAWTAGARPSWIAIISRGRSVVALVPWLRFRRRSTSDRIQ